MAGKPRTASSDVFTQVEEATHLLRRAPAAAWLTYFAGSAPFVTFLFYFWSDMSRSPLASRHLVEFSLILALLYVWMKIWHAIFCSHLMALVEGRKEPGRLSPIGWLRLVGSQALVHSTMPLFLGIAAVAMVPLAWVYAFYHNVTVLAVPHFRDGGRSRALFTKALAQTHFQPMTNHILIVVISLFGIVVYLNLLALFGLGASLLKSITGTENAFSMNGMTLLSTVIQALIVSVAYLVVNPFAKALYTLRCFYGSARRSGADIEVSLRALAVTKLVPVVLLLGVSLCSGAGALAQDTAPAAPSAVLEQPTSGNVPGKDLDRSIRDVLQGSEYQWRLPREIPIAEQNSWLGSLARDVGNWFEKILDTIGRIIADILDWLFDREGSSQKVGHASGSAWLAAVPKLLIGLVIVLLAVLVLMLLRNWHRARTTAVVEAEAAAPVVNLEHEQVLASQLPENEWLALAREKMDAGELRLALRALFLATLAHLGEKRLLQIARSKSNGDYVRELGWRARGRAELNERFGGQVRTFDRVWYGWHEVSPDLMRRFQEEHERITVHAA